MRLGKADWRTFDRGTEKEWLITNGIGGFASSTVIGANTRRYHGLLIAALNPPVERHLVLAKIDESISADGRTFDLYSYRTPGHTLEGFKYLQAVEMDSVPVFTCRVGDVLLEKTVVMPYGSNTVCVVYRLCAGSSDVVLRLAPLVNYRDYHHTSSKRHMRFKAHSFSRGVSIIPYELDREIRITATGGKFIEKSGCWFENMLYPVENERGLDCVEDHFIPGYFEVEVKKGREEVLTITASLDGHEYLDGPEAVLRERERTAELERLSGLKDGFALELVRAADRFVADRKSTASKTVIAGYPWFTDWGRDTMTAFTGLTLVTRRFDAARSILGTFAAYERDGLLPNVFPDAGVEPPYNSVDAPLWYFEAVYRYLVYTGDLAFVREKICPVLQRIIEGYSRGTHYNIKMDGDGLITAGDENTQLTWMDATAGGRAVTPRHGKAVEINALWYNALKVMEYVSEELGQDGAAFRGRALMVRDSFAASFWNEEAGCLYDCIAGRRKDGRVRPNQILAVSLSFPVLEGEVAKRVVDRVLKELYTDFGLKTLAESSPEYRGRYQGDQFSRDSGYHQGTVWPWLLGRFITGFVRVRGNTAESRTEAMELLKPVLISLKDGGVGTIGEIFDGDPPHYPRGCFAQAWSVGEVLRAYVEDILQIEP